jgi:hypothetical protein
MNMRESFVAAEPVHSAQRRPQPAVWTGSCQRLDRWVNKCANRYAAAAAYAELASLSGAGLRHRSLRVACAKFWSIRVRNQTVCRLRLPGRQAAADA